MVFSTNLRLPAQIDPHALAVQRNRFPGLITALGCVKKISNDDFLHSLGRVDLLLGSTPCSQLTLLNSRRLEFSHPESTANLIFNFQFIRDFFIRKHYANSVPFFWLAENTAHMSKKSRCTIENALGCKANVFCSSSFSPAYRKRLFFGNLPGMTELASKLSSTVCDETLQSVLGPHRVALRKFANCITSNEGNQLFPVLFNGEPSSLTTNEIELLLGLPRAFTDCDKLSARQRLKLLARAWSVPTVMAILQPLSELFKVVTS